MCPFLKQDSLVCHIWAQIGPLRIEDLERVMQTEALPYVHKFAENTNPKVGQKITNPTGYLVPTCVQTHD